MIYLDSSALLKLLFEERESAELEGWLSEHSTAGVTSSALARVEVVRAARRLDPAQVPAAYALVDGLDLVPVSAPLLRRAADLGGPLLRSLDAVHLASALSLAGALTAFVAYDHRLADAADDEGLAVVAPGA